MRTVGPPPRGASSGRLMRMAGLFGMLVGAAILLRTATGDVKFGGHKDLGYMAGGVIVAYGFFRYLRGRSADKDGSGPPPSRYQR